MTDDVQDLRDTIVPKSDQLNADDLLTGPITAKISPIFTWKSTFCNALIPPKPKEIVSTCSLTAMHFSQESKLYLLCKL